MVKDLQRKSQQAMARDAVAGALSAMVAPEGQER
jgi:hypothetical protein